MLCAIVTENEALVPNRYKRVLQVGFALKTGQDLERESAKETMAWLSKNAVSLMDAAFALPELMQFLCEHRLIKPKALEAYLESAQKRNDPELTEALMKYQKQVKNVPKQTGKK